MGFRGSEVRILSLRPISQPVLRYFKSGEPVGQSRAVASVLFVFDPHTFGAKRESAMCTRTASPKGDTMRRRAVESTGAWDDGFPQTAVPAMRGESAPKWAVVAGMTFSSRSLD